MVVTTKFKLHVAKGQLRQVQLAVDPRLRILPLPGDDPPSVEMGTESGQTRLITVRWPHPISDSVALEATFLFNGASAVGNIRLPHIELLGIPTTRRWMAVSVDPALDSDEQQEERLRAVSVADFLEGMGAADSKPRAAYRLPGGEIGWTLATRPHEPRTTADQTLTLSFDEHRVDVRFKARLSIASGYVFQHRLTAPKQLKIDRVSVMEEDAERVERWSQDADGAVTVFLNGPGSGAERLLLEGHLPIRLGEKFTPPAIRVEKCRIRSANIRLFRRPGVLLTIDGGTPVAESVKETPELGRLVETIAWDVSHLPPATITARSNPSNIHRPPAAAIQPRDRKDETAASPRAVVRVADVTLSCHADGGWCAVATFDIESGDPEQIELNLPSGGELVETLVDNVPATPKLVGNGVWQLSPAPAKSLSAHRRDLPRRLPRDGAKPQPSLRGPDARQPPGEADPLDTLPAAIVDDWRTARGRRRQCPKSSAAASRDRSGHRRRPNAAILRFQRGRSGVHARLPRGDSPSWGHRHPSAPARPRGGKISRRPQ